MSATVSRPDDGVVVYRAHRQAFLDGAVQALAEAGIPAVAAWRAAHGYPHEGSRDPGEGEVLVPAAQLGRAREVLLAREAQSEARIREHLKELPAQLRRIVVIPGLGVLGLMTAAGDAWRSHPTAMTVFAAALAPLVLWEVAALLRARRDRAERARFSIDQPPRWFER